MSALPQTMQAWEIRGEGGIDALQLGTRAVPSPGEGEVLIKVAASALNYRDLSTILSPAARNLVYPRIPNSDCAGEIVAIGAGVDDWRPGDRVMGCFFQNWADGRISAAAMPSALGGPIDGVLSEYVALRADAVVAVPQHLSWSEAATLPCAALTAWNCLFEQGHLSADKTILLLGTGGVSVFALQFAALFGLRVIITSSSDAKLDRARQMGAAQTINYRTHENWDEQVLQLTDGEGVDFVLEVGGGGTLARSLNAVRVGGMVTLIGVLTSGTIEPTVVMRKSIELHGVYVGSRRMFEDMSEAISRHRLQPVVDSEFAFDRAREAFHYLQGGGHFGKVVIRM